MAKNSNHLLFLRSLSGQLLRSSDTKQIPPVLLGAFVCPGSVCRLVGGTLLPTVANPPVGARLLLMVLALFQDILSVLKLAVNFYLYLLRLVEL